MLRLSEHPFLSDLGHTSMRRVELLSGAAAGLAGLLGLAVALIGVGQRVTLGAVPFLLALTLALLGIAMGAYLHSERGLREGRVMLWASVTLLSIGTVLAAASFGLVLLPALLLGLAAAAAAKTAPPR